jgi:hypothetical protein
MPVPVGVLDDLASSLRINLTGTARPEPGQTVTASIRPFLSDVDFTDILAGALGLTWLTKDVRFADADLEPSLDPAAINAKILGGMPISGLPGTQATPGLIGQLTGTLPIPSTTKLKLQVQIQWSVSADPEGSQILNENDAFIAPAGLTNPDASFIFRPETFELTTDPPPPPVPKYLRARVKLVAGGTETAWRDLPPVPVLVPPLGIPVVLAMFLHGDFQPRSGDDDGAVLVLVPANSPVGSIAQLQPLLDQIDSVASTLSTFASFAAFLGGLSELTGALPPQPHVQFRSTNAVGNLNDITLIQRGFFENDTEAEDELSSIIFIGPAGKRAQCFNDRDFDTDEGAFTLSVGPNFFTLVRDLDGKHPGSEPPGLLNVDREPPGGVFNPDKFNDELSSVRFP